MPEVSLKELIASGAHFGHQTRRWNPKMKEFIYGEKDGIHIFDLTKTKEALDEALNVLKTASKEGKTILFVGTKKQAKEQIKKVAEDSGSFFINERWLGGILTNFEQVKRSLQKLEEMKKGLESGEYKGYTKKERLLIDREVQRLIRFFGGLVGMQKLPDLLVIVDVRREITAVKEAIASGVTTVGIVDSNSDPTDLDYPIPMNDDATRAVEYVLELMGETIIEGKGSKKKTEKQKS
ncbi:30S ribosomal protein S2 [Candidatus Woesebacteria bacterium RIFCSPHIGHO2_01_FULL_39_32]|uniref:Small ribosomal subunit protein uS2 n=2 Tax=Candidatus Woeseibacteriota TaxID=1752722 RepID=A0A0G0Q091_9BACT|nr:MAG: 30S ribosomal protein S2 [Candidatus Woesebacteria bacterium GW2011_GWA1_39_8]OGM04624.1 MAG: 30S ribosomal protein S2 [Candidatus Woesebacteria bacterium GWB1_37_5]OGM23962.1 MAG: 30S ribosomal protein S2 [Candidatus Woesebacteria bacterium RIFCSPHIGHO2_01_FULL_39_32]OGM37468.1 MAG: 30S ribosomal protein S2 [Candidatus Woesebacteria bacterium RIFCSPHIGHO2_12_FULL_38_11]OGM64151.1 MAG: 30S ribosomal protein S2 [Candidatus Woesebacteria bacterium RIFCSPLOWO2_01_FULL_39_25]